MSDYSLYAPRECSRFNECDCGNCPLHLEYNKALTSHDCDPTPKCTMAKANRLRIGLKYHLPNLGLTQREFASRKAWEALPEEQKQVKREAMRKRAILLRPMEKGKEILEEHKSVLTSKENKAIMKPEALSTNSHRGEKWVR